MTSTDETRPDRSDVRAAISNAYYECRNQGATMEEAADRAADAVLALIPAPQDECPHLAESGDEGPVRELHGGLMTVIRWRCDGCGRIRYDDESLDRLRALFAATTERLAALARPTPHPQGGTEAAVRGLLSIIDDRVWRIEARCSSPVGPDEPCGACAPCWTHNVEVHAAAVRALLAAAPAPTEGETTR